MLPTAPSTVPQHTFADMLIRCFLAGLRPIPLASPGVLLVEDPADRGPPRVVASGSDLGVALRVRPRLELLLEVLGEGPWAAGPVLLPEHVRAVDPHGQLLGTLAAALPWVLLPPEELRGTAAAVAGDPAADLTGTGGSPRHRLNLLQTRYRRALAGDPVVARLARNVLDELGHRLG